MLMRSRRRAARRYDLSALRHVVSVGEPLNAEAVRWGERALGLPIHDTWWQTETGAIMIANFPGIAHPARLDGTPDARRGGGPSWPARDGRRAEAASTGARAGAATTRTRSASWRCARAGRRCSASYLRRRRERYRACFADGWYLSGDLARRDADGYFWFVGRGDDVIKSAGHLVGPFEVESVLMEHPAVVEAGVIGKPDPMAGEVVKAFVTLRDGVRAGRGAAPRADRLRPAAARRAGAAADRLRPAPAAHPQRQGHAPAAQGARAGLPEGDMSTVEGGAMTATPSGRGPRRAKLRVAPPVAPGEADGQAGLLYRQMLRIRRFEEKCVELYSAEKIRGFMHLCIGEEAVAVGVMQALAADDAVVATYREHGHALARGMRMAVLSSPRCSAGSTGCSRGRGGSMHLFDASLRFYGGNAIVGGGLPLAVGLALAEQMRGTDRVTACVFGDGAFAEGEFHESANLAALWQLAGRLLLREQPIRDGYRAGPRARRRPTWRCGPPPTAWWRGRWTAWTCWRCATRRAGRSSLVRDGGGPCFVELHTYRFRAHSMYDPDRYRDKAEIAQWRERDPLPALADRLRATGRLDDADLAAMEERDRGGDRRTRSRRPTAHPIEPVERAHPLRLQRAGERRP